MIVRFEVMGTPIPQGSKSSTRWGMREANPKTRPWRDQIAWEARAAMGHEPPLEGPCTVNATFWMPRPKSHYRANGQIKPTAPVYSDKRPDVDKLLRALCDGMTTAGVWKDDSQAVRIEASKRYVINGVQPGCSVAVTTIREAA